MKINGKPDGGGGREPIVESLSVTQNGIYTPEPGVDGFDNVDVNVPAPEFVTETLNVSVNNTYYPGQGVDGFSQVVVDVPQSVTGFTEKDITEGQICIQNLNNSASFVVSGAFAKNTCLQTINLPNATYIDNDAFMYCKSLSQVSLPNVSSVGVSAFTETSLTQLDLPNCEFISGHAFMNCSSLSQVSLPICKYIGGSTQEYLQYEKVFQSCPLTNIDLPMCSLIGPTAFDGCSVLSQVSLPECEQIGKLGFNNCKSLTMVDLPKCSFIDRQAFQNCWSLSQVSLPECITLGGSAFLYCSSLSQVILPKVVNLDGSNIFNGCSSLELLSLPTSNYIFFSYYNYLVNTKLASGIGSIYVPDFNYDRYISATGWSSLADRFVSVPVSETILSYSDGLVYGQTNALDYYFNSYLGINYNTVTGISLPDCTYVQNKPGTSPATYPFKECANLQTFVLGTSIISASLCEKRSLLQYVELPNCKQILISAFGGCTSLSQVSLPECESIGNYAFYKCSALQSIDLPKCTSLGASVFGFCNSLTTVNLPVLKSLNFNPFYNCTSLSQISLPELEYIGSGTDFQYLPLQSIDLPKCSYFGGKFFHCTSLSQVSLPECEYLGYQAFRECNLQSIDLPKCSFIDSQAFASNVSLSEITLRSNTVCSLKDFNWTFNNTPFRSGNGSVYVPASLVDAYKTAQYWSELASQIFPIPE